VICRIDSQLPNFYANTKIINAPTPVVRVAKKTKDDEKRSELAIGPVDGFHFSKFGH
jgi:hypothetical protein